MASGLSMWLCYFVVGPRVVSILVQLEVIVIEVDEEVQVVEL